MNFFFIILFFFPSIPKAQSVYRIGDNVTDLHISKILNYTSQFTDLNKIKNTITIIDFFGTYCVPCIKALPELTNYKNKFNNNLSVVLVSNETESKLKKFISSHQPFIFPLVVDENNAFTNAFQPPSYPYTVVLDKNLKVILITNPANLTEAMIAKFIEDGQTNHNAPEAVYEMKTENITNPNSISNDHKNDLVKLSQDFMYAAKTNVNVSEYISQLKALDYHKLKNDLINDDDKKAFWINLYNAYTNASLHKNSDQYKNRSKFFKAKNIIIAGKSFSLDKIEHDILRRGKIKWSLGYFSKLFPSKTAKNLRVNKLDYRIHFALNCGAKSCPPIAFYNSENINTQLNVAANAFLTSEVEYNVETNILKLPVLLSWFRGDFGGKKRIIELLKYKQIIPLKSTPKIKYKKYDWTLYLDNYK